MHTLSNRISTVDSCDSPGGGDESSTEDNVASFLFLPDDNIIKRIDVCHVTRLLLLYILYFCLFAILLSLSSSLFGIGLGSLLVFPLYIIVYFVLVVLCVGLDCTAEIYDTSSAGKTRR